MIQLQIVYIIVMKPITLKLTHDQIFDLKKRYHAYKIRTDLPYTHFQIRGDDFTITAYTSGKVVFQGHAAVFHASLFGYVESEETQSTKKVSTQINATPTRYPMAGSDEVGTGDYFGPITVCAAYLTDADLNVLPVSKIVDSKQINDDTIRQLAPVIMETITYSLLVLENAKYNSIHKTMNMNVIKAKLHNKAFLNLSKKITMPTLSVIDQFMPKDAYFKALAQEPEVYKDLTFETKAENKYLAVACAAIIARFAFLEALDQLGTLYDFEFPKGAGAHVDIAGKVFIERHGQEALHKVAKTHFANTQKIINL